MNSSLKKEDIPTGAVICSRDNAVTYFMEKIYDHKPLKDVVALRYGSAASGAMASITGIVMLRQFRKFVGLRREAALSTSIASLFVPCIGSFLYHYLFITPTILLEEIHCKACLELEAVGIQFMSGVVMPYCLSMISTGMTATRIGINMPSMMKPMDFIRFSWYLTNKGNGLNKLAGCLVFNILGIILLVNAEESQVVTFKRRLEARRMIDT